MQNSQRLVASTLVKAQDFIEQNEALVGEAASSVARTRLRSIVTSVFSHHSAQSEHKMSAQTLSRSKAAARRALVQDNLSAIAATARAEMGTVPELEVLSTVPNATASVGKLLTRAENVLKVAVPFTTALVNAGLPGDFIAQLQAATDSLGEVAERKSSTLDMRAGATVGIRTELIAGRRQVRILDRFVRTALRGKDEARLKEWRERTAVPKSTPAVAVEQPATPAAPAVSAAA